MNIFRFDRVINWVITNNQFYFTKKKKKFAKLYKSRALGRINYKEFIR